MRASRGSALRLAVSAVLALSVAVVVDIEGRSSVSAAPPAIKPAQTLEVFYSSPVLARAGEAIRIPVDVVCGTDQGVACAATALVGVSEGGGPFNTFSGDAAPNVEFDVTAPAARAVQGVPTSGSIRLQIQARDQTGKTVCLNGTGTAPPPLRLYVAETMPTLQIPQVAFGDTVPGQEVLYLPWGSGPSQAGLRPGNESPTLGPSSFDVSPTGSIVLVDAMQSRVAEFRNGALARTVPLAVDPWADIAVGSDGLIYLASRLPDSEWQGQVRTIDSAGTLRTLSAQVPGMPSQIRSSASGVFVRLLPEDAWVPAATGKALSLTTGRPTTGTKEVVFSGTQNAVRIGMVSGSAVLSALELQSPVMLGSVQLAERDGTGGFWLVVHTFRDGFDPVDQYQVIHATSDLHVTTFATPSGGYAESMTLSRFRLGPDNAIYQMRTAADGVRIFRYPL